MKKFLTLIAALFCSAAALCAQNAVAFTVHVDDPSHVVVTLGDNTLTADSNGNYAVDATYDANYNLPALRIVGVAPFEVKAATYMVDYSTEPQTFSVSNGKIESSYYSSLNGLTLNVVTYDPSTVRTATLTVSVDDASMVRAMVGQRAIDLSNGDNTVKFDPTDTSEKFLSIAPVNYSVPLYKVLLNGEPAAAQGSYFNFQIKDGDNVQITAKIPAEPAEISFSFPGDDLSAVLVVTLDGKPATITDGKIAATTGQAIAISVPDTYNVSAFAIDGQTQSFYGSYNGVILKDTAFEFNAKKYSTIKVKVNVNPDHVLLYNSHSAYGDPIEIAGDGTIELSERNAIISWAAKTGCYIESVAVNENPVGEYVNSVQLAEGDVFSIVSGKYVMDRTAVIWVDNKELADQYFNFEASTRDRFDLTSGYNKVEFHNGMSPFQLSWYSSQTIVGKVFVNGELKSAMYEGSSNYQLNLGNGDVVKVFFEAEPVEAKANITVDDNVEATILRDHISPVEAGEHTVYNGTEFAISGTGLDVKVGDSAIQPDENGTYIVKVNGDTNISVAKSANVAISEINAPANSARAIFDIQGRRLAAPARGINIINGRKVLIK